MEPSNSEIWKSIDGFANYEVYPVSGESGMRRRNMLKPIASHGGNVKVILSKHGTATYFVIHRLVANEFIDNPSNKACVDHIDGDRTNNCVTNLRYATKSENGMNQKKHLSATSIYKGVYFDKRSSKWHARVRLSGVRTDLGYFDSEDEAAQAHNEAATRMFGEFAKLNVIT